MNLKPIGDNIVVKMTEVEETTKSGIILTSSAKEKPQIAEVVAVGPGGVIDGKEVKMEVEKGDKVALGILNRNMAEAANIIETAAKNFGDVKIPVVLAGGLTNQPAVVEALKENLSNSEKFEIKILDKEPVMGALMLAEEEGKNA